MVAYGAFAILKMVDPRARPIFALFAKRPGLILRVWLLLTALFTRHPRRPHRLTPKTEGPAAIPRFTSYFFFLVIFTISGMALRVVFL